MDKDEIRKIIGIETTYPNGVTVHPPRGFYTVGQLCDALRKLPQDAKIWTLGYSRDREVITIRYCSDDTFGIC
jgi:hypothetical protein